MARGGIDKTDVKRAREALLVRGENPSIDAVRVELGNTGSKTTIHRYLRELEAEDAMQVSSEAFLSDSLKVAVAALARQLQEESAAVIADREQAFDAEMATMRGCLKEKEAECEGLQDQLTSMSRAHESEVSVHSRTRSELEAMTERVVALELVKSELAVELKEKSTQILSLEDKHKQAREGLDHYRNAVKEQREQEARRFDHQIQQLQVDKRELALKLDQKQEEASTLRTENASLTVRLQTLQQGLADQEKTNRLLSERLQAQTERIGELQAVAEKLATLKQAHENLKADYDLAHDGLRSKELELAGHKAESATLTKLMAALEGRSQNAAVQSGRQIGAENLGDSE